MPISGIPLICVSMRIAQVFLSILAFSVLLTCGGGPSSTTPGGHDGGVADGGNGPGDPLACRSGESCACISDADCAGDVCECTDATCTQRACTAVACACGYGADCANLADGVEDPNSCHGASACFGGACLAQGGDPGTPAFSDTIGTLSVVVRTGDGEIAGTSDPVSLCLSADDCFDLDRAGISDLRSGNVDTFHFEDIAVPRSRVDRMELRIAGQDDWEPACVALRFDGEPVYCIDPTPFVLGDESSSTPAWSDPAGYHVDCTSCYAKTLTHGPVIGAVGPDSARIWIRTDASRPVGLRLSGSPDLSAAPVVGWVYPAAEDDFAAVLEAQGLQPSTTYYYGIDIDGVLVSDPTYSFETPPAAGDQAAFTFAFGSCSRYNHPQDIFTPMAAAPPDLFLFTGDIHYGDVTTLDELRWNFQWGLEVPGRGDLMARTPTLAVWDDHDYLGNNTDGTHPARAVARRVFEEYWPNPAFGENGEGIYFKHSYGDVDFFMLDVRSFRDPLGLPMVFGDGAGRASLLGPAQTKWLLAELTASTAAFKIVVGGSQWTDHGNDDSWASFPEARDAIFDAIEAQRIEGVILLSGDRHRAEIRMLPRETGYDLPELTSSPLANTVRDCASDDDIQSCHDQGYYVMYVDVDTTVADPRFTATINMYQDGALVPVDKWSILRSQLSL